MSNFGSCDIFRSKMIKIDKDFQKKKINRTEILHYQKISRELKFYVITQETKNALKMQILVERLIDTGFSTN